MKQHSLIEIKGKDTYLCRVDSLYTIIEVTPPSDFFISKDIREVYSKYKDQATFTLKGKEDCDVFVSEDVFNRFVEKSEKFNLLCEKFDLVISS